MRSEFVSLPLYGVRLVTNTLSLLYPVPCLTPPSLRMGQIACLRGAACAPARLSTTSLKHSTPHQTVYMRDAHCSLDSHCALAHKSTTRSLHLWLHPLSTCPETRRWYSLPVKPLMHLRTVHHHPHHPNKVYVLRHSYTCSCFASGCQRPVSSQISCGFISLLASRGLVCVESNSGRTTDSNESEASIIIKVHSRPILC